MYSNQYFDISTVAISNQNGYYKVFSTKTFCIETLLLNVNVRLVDLYTYKVNNISKSIIYIHFY